MSTQVQSNQKLIVELENGIKRITFNRPERRNAVDFEMFEQFASAVQKSSSDDTRVIVISGAGDSFCSGLDLSSLSASQFASLDVAASVRELINPPIRGLRSLAVPVIAQVHGPAVGIGFSYVLASDIRIASEAAQFSQSFIRIGLMPDGGSTYFLPRMVGYSRAFELMATGVSVDARQALDLGLINRVVGIDELETTVNELAARLAASPQPSLTKIKTALANGEMTDLDAALEFEAQGQAECFHSHDFMEGLTAFAEKRQPVFGGSRKAGGE